MKLRKGFVSNSSTSSFICDICGTVEAGRDMYLRDFEMVECKRGHCFHKSCVPQKDLMAFEEAEEKLRKHEDGSEPNPEIEKIFDQCSYGEVPIVLCPVCQLHVVTDKMVTMHLHVVTGKSFPVVVEEILANYKSYDELNKAYGVVTEK